MTLPQLSIPASSVKPRTGEPYLSQAANQKFLGQPRGVYLGFIPAVTAGSLVLTLGVQPIYGVSLVRTRSLIDPINVDVFTDQPVLLDFTGHDFVVNPTVYVKVRASEKLGSPTTAEVFTTAAPGESPTEQLACKVTKPAANLVVVYDAPTNRSTPYAFGAAPLGFGFMRDNAVEELLACVAMVAEVAAARVDLVGVNHPYAPIPQQGISDRIAADLQPAAVASRLGLSLNVIRSEDYPVAVPATSINVSSSFSVNGRTRAPVMDVAPGGTELAPGAITDPTDLDRNVCFIMQVGTNERPVDDDRAVVYGRLQADVLELSGAVSFPGGTGVTGVATLFLAEVLPGDIVLAANGDYFVVASVTTDFALVLATAAPAGGPITATRRRFTLSVVKRNVADNTENPFAIPAATTIRFFFGAWFTTETAVHDARLLMLAEGGEEPPLPDATITVKGQAIMHPGLSGVVGGAVRVLVENSPVGSGRPTYGLNFNYSPVAASPGVSGVANVAAAGATGPIGPPGTGPGGIGPTGPPGTGITNFSVPFSPSGVFTPAGQWAPGELLTHTVVFPGPLKYVHGGICKWTRKAPGGALGIEHHFNLTSVVLTAGNTTATVTNTIPSTGTIRDQVIQLFLNGAG